MTRAFEDGSLGFVQLKGGCRIRGGRAIGLAVATALSAASLSSPATAATNGERASVLAKGRVSVSSPLLMPIGDGLGDVLKFEVVGEIRPGYETDPNGYNQVAPLPAASSIVLKLPTGDVEVARVASTSAKIRPASGRDFCDPNDSSTWPWDESVYDYDLAACPSVTDVWTFQWDAAGAADVGLLDGQASLDVQSEENISLGSVQLHAPSVTAVKASPTTSTYFPYRDGVKDWADVKFHAEAVGGIRLPSTAVAEVRDEAGRLVSKMESLAPGRVDHSFRIAANQHGKYTVNATLTTQFGSGQSQSVVTASPTKLSAASISASSGTIRADRSPKTVTISSRMTSSSGSPTTAKGSIQVLRGSSVVATIPLNTFSGRATWNGRIRGKVVLGTYSVRGVFRGPEGPALTTRAARVEVVGFTIKPVVGTPAGADIRTKRVTVKQGKKVLASNKASVQVGSGQFTVTSKVTYRPWLYKKVWKTKTKVNTKTTSIRSTKCRVAKAYVLDDRTSFQDNYYINDYLYGQATIGYIGRCEGMSEYVSWADDVYILADWDGYSTSRESAILSDSSILVLGDVDYVSGTVVLAWNTKVRYQATVGYWGSVRTKTATRTIRL